MPFNDYMRAAVLEPLGMDASTFADPDPDRLAEFYARQMPLKIVRLPKPLPRLEEVMQWHAFRNTDPGLLWLRRTLKGFAKRTSLVSAR